MLHAGLLVNTADSALNVERRLIEPSAYLDKILKSVPRWLY